MPTDPKKKIDPTKIDLEKKEEDEVEESDEEEEKDESSDEDSSDTENKIDYKALAAEEKQKREDAERALAEKRFKSSERKRKQEDEEDEEDEEEDKPISRREFRNIIEETAKQTEKRLMGTQIRDIASKLGDSPEEVEAIIETHANRSFPSYIPLQQQMEESHAIVNRKRILSINGELKRGLKGKENASKDISQGHRDGNEGVAYKLPAEDTESYKRAGFQYDSKTRVYKKKLPSGKFLFKNPKTKQTWVA